MRRLLHELFAVPPDAVYGKWERIIYLLLTVVIDVFVLARFGLAAWPVIPFSAALLFVLFILRY